MPDLFWKVRFFPSYVKIVGLCLVETKNYLIFQVEKVIVAAEAKGRKIAAFICEPMFVIPGVYPTQPAYFKHVYRLVNSLLSNSN